MGLNQSQGGKKKYSDIFKDNSLEITLADRTNEEDDIARVLFGNNPECLKSIDNLLLLRSEQDNNNISFNLIEALNKLILFYFNLI